MFHSTDSWENVENILENGFRNSNTTDNMLGAGIYVSRSIDKARAYGDFTFKLLVYPGLVKAIRSQGDPWQKTWQEDYGCAWVPPNSGMVPSGLEVGTNHLSSA